MHTAFPLTFSFLRILRETKSELQLYGTAYDRRSGMTEESAFCSSGKDLSLNLSNGSLQGVTDDRAVVFKKF